MIESLLDQMHTVMMAADCPVNVGNDFDNIQERQRRLKLANLKDGCRKALWFGDTFNIDLVSIVFRTRASI